MALWPRWLLPLLLPCSTAAVAAACQVRQGDVGGEVDLEIPEVRPYDNCVHLCSAVGWCEWFTWREADGSCALKRRDGAFVASSTEKSGARCALESCFAPEEFRYSGRELSKHEDVTSSDACAHICSAATGCVSWTLTSGTCSLFSSLLPSRRADTNSLSGLPCGTGCLVETGVRYGSLSTVLGLYRGVASSEVCAAKCTGGSRCMGWTYGRSGTMQGVCSLLSGTLSRKANSDYVSGLPCTGTTATTTPCRRLQHHRRRRPGDGDRASGCASPAPPPAADGTTQAVPSVGSTRAPAAVTTTTVGGASGVAPQPPALATPPPTASSKGRRATTSTVATSSTLTTTSQGGPAVVEGLLQEEGHKVLWELTMQPGLQSASASREGRAKTTGRRLGLSGVDEVKLAGSSAKAVVPSAAVPRSWIGDEVACVLTELSTDYAEELVEGETAKDVRGLVSVELWSLQKSERLRVQNLVDADRVAVHIPVAGELSADGLVCAYFDEEKKAWATDGLFTTLRPGPVLECSTPHLTIFAAIARGFLKSYECANVDAASWTALQEIFRGGWQHRTFPALYFAVLTGFVVLLVVACLADYRNARAVNSLTDECFLFFTDEEEEQAQKDASYDSAEPEEGAHPDCCTRAFGHGCCFGGSLGSAWTQCKESSALRDAIDDVASRWVLYFSEIRDLLESLLTRLRGCEVAGAEGGLILAAASALMGTLACKTVRRQAGISLRCSDELLVFLTEDEEIAAVFLRAALLQPALEERRATDEEKRIMAWGKLHEEVLKTVDQHWEGFGSWRGLPSLSWRLFVAQTPMVNVLLRNPFVPSSQRVLLLACDLSGSFMLAALFFVASGNMRGKRSRGECLSGGAGETIGRVLSIALASTLLAGLPVGLLSSLHSRGLRRFRRGQEAAFQRQLRVWRMQDGALWVLGITYVTLCNLFVSSFLANLHPNFQPAYGTSGAISLTQELLVVPFALAVVVPGVAQALLTLTSAVQRADPRALLRKRREQLTARGNWASFSLAI